MEFRLRPLSFMEFFAKQKQQCLMVVVLQKTPKTLHETQGSQSKFHELDIYI